MSAGFTWWFGLVVAMAGCSGSTATSSPLTTGGEGECTPDPAPIDPACVLCEPNANAPSISGRLVVEGTEAMPAASGGDPTGVWVGRNVIVQLPAAAGEFVDIGGSSFHGSGWIIFGGDGTFEFLIDGEATVLLSGASEPIVRGATGGAKGTYSVQGTSLSFAPECQFSDSEETIEGGGIRLDSNPFSVSGSTMTLQAQMTVQGISVNVVLELDSAS
jgi:hypothetical protein